MSCSVPTTRLTPEREQEIVEALRRTVDRIERHLPRPTFGPATL